MKTGPEINLTSTWSIIHSGIVNGALGGCISVSGGGPVQLFFGDATTSPTVDDEGPNVLDYAPFIVSGAEVLWGRALVKNTTVRVQPNMLWPVGTPNAGSLNVQNYIEFNTKAGTEFEASSFLAALAPGANADVVFTTGAKPVIIKYREIQHNGTRVTLSLFKAPTFTGGTLQPIYNMTDINPAATTVQIHAGVTVTATGAVVGTPRDFLGSDGLGSSRPAQGAALGLDRVLAPNTSYLSRITNQGAAAIMLSSYTSWYEGALS